MSRETVHPGQWLLVSDVDDTLTGNRTDLETLWQALKESKGAVRLALNSSRPAGSVDETIRDYFPSDFVPDAIITGLGTEIRVAGAFLESWQRQFAGWPDEKVRTIVAAMGFEPHKDAFQTPGKASFAVPGKENADLVLQRLDAEGIGYRFIYSGESDLDILAPGAGKDAAARHLADHFGIGIDSTVAAGDSGNDLALFEVAGKAIAVGNARNELLNSMPTRKTYLAKARHAAGVLEGLVALGVLT